jgi:hypothetical protein
VRGARLFTGFVLAMIVGIGAAHLLAGGFGPDDVATRPADRSDPPTGYRPLARSTMVVELEPVGAPLDDGTVEVAVRVRNANATAVSALRVRVVADGGSCGWPEGTFPDPFGLSPGADTARTCRFRPDGAGAPRLGVEVIARSVPVGRATLDLPGPAPASGPAPVEPDQDPARQPSPPAGATPAPGGEPAVPASPPVSCPRLVGPGPGASLILDHLGPRLAERSAALDRVACPEWSPVSGLRATAQTAEGACGSWLVWLPAATDPAVRLTPTAPAPSCAAAPLTIEVFDQPTAVAAQLTALVAWTIEAEAARVAAHHAVAASGAGPACEPGSLVAVRNPYEVTSETGRRYTAEIVPC